MRIVSLSSEAARAHPIGGIVFRDLKTTQSKNAFWLAASWQRYGQSKLANVLYASELARRYGEQGILAVSIHPGVFHTGLVENLSLASRVFVWVGTAGQVKDAKKGG